MLTTFTTAIARPRPAAAAIALLILELAGCGRGAVGAQPRRGASTPSANAIPRFGDSQVAAAVRRQLELERGLDARQIQASARHGIVALHGVARNPGEAARAVSAAQLASGVRAVVSYLRVPDGQASDSALAANVLAELQRRAQLDPNRLQVSADAGRVKLTGTVSSLSQRRTAESAAWSVYGVTAVQNAVRVVARPRPDAEISQEVQARLAADGYGPGAVRVAARGGVVTVSGEVKGVFDKRRVLERAAVDGVVQVRDELSVQQEREEWDRPYTGIRSAGEMRTAILDAYALDPRVPENAVRVNVRSGVAELSGAVATQAQRIAAGDDAANTVGVWAVRNQLALTGAPAADATLRRELEARLTGHPYVTGSDIDVNVERGQVVLTGKVLGSFQSRVAERTAQLTPGVVSVENRLQLEKVPGNLRGDDDIRREIEAALARDSLVDGSKVKVSVESGVATISGVVENWEVYSAVLEDVFGALPLGVVNQLQRRKPPQLLYSH
jgi:osmotically-inducible protein OsmY